MLSKILSLAEADNARQAMQLRGNNTHEAYSAQKAANGNARSFTKNTTEQSLQHKDDIWTCHSNYMTGIVECDRR